MLRRVVTWLSPGKIHKLELTNGFGTLLRALAGSLAGRLARGPAAARLEQGFRERFPGTDALIFPHARTACHFILKGLGLQPGDEVVMTPMTIADMVNSIHTLGLRPVFVEMELRTFSFDLAALERAITPRTKAVLVTPIFGLVPDMGAIARIARERGLHLIEDCSQCFGGTLDGRQVGTFGAAAFFSLTNFKVVSSLFGGMAVTRDPALAGRLRELRERELLPPQAAPLVKLLLKNLVYTVFFSRPVFSYFTYFVVVLLERIDPQITYRLYSGNIKVILGQYENRLLERFPASYLADYSDVQARVGLAALARADGRTVARARNGELLRGLLEGLPGVVVPRPLPGAVNVYWRFPVITADRAGLKNFLLENGVDTAPPYLALCSREPGFERYRAALPVAERIKDAALVVEVHEGLSERAIRRTAALIAEHVGRGGEAGRAR